MSPKELNYIEDALGHEQFLKTQCQEAIQNLQDPTLKNQVQQMTQCGVIRFFPRPRRFGERSCAVNFSVL